MHSPTLKLVPILLCNSFKGENQNSLRLHLVMRMALSVREQCVLKIILSINDKIIRRYAGDSVNFLCE